MTNTKVFWLHTLSPTHVGTGRGLGYIDLPIHREKVTNWPAIPGSAFKGVWADYFRATKENRETDSELCLAFGRASDSDNTSNAGALIPTDARLVCLPVRSFQGTFAWCTSPLVLQMLHRDLTLAGMIDVPEFPTGLGETSIHHPSGTILKRDERIYLEDLDFIAEESALATNWARKIGNCVFADDAQWKDDFIKRFAILPDTVFDFLTETATEVTTRVKIDQDTKTVVEGALWTEESIPTETILAGFITCDRLHCKAPEEHKPENLLARFAKQQLILQIGGKATVGRGRVRCIFTSVSGEGQ